MRRVPSSAKASLSAFCRVETMRRGKDFASPVSDANGPTIIATRYVGSGAVGAKRCTSSPFSMTVGPASGALPIAVRPLGARRVRVKGVLKPGWSKPGNAARA